MNNLNTVRFARTTFAAGRPEVLPFLVEAVAYDWGIYAKFHGTEADLIAAGLATPDMFRDLGKSGQRTRPDGYGNRCIVRRRRGKWGLEIYTRDESRYGDPADESMRKGKWWRENGAGVEAATVEILARFVRAHRETRS